MTNTLSPAEHLAAIITAGVARFEATLPDYAQTICDDVEEAHPVIVLGEDRQRELCLSCPLAECVGLANAECPIRIAQREMWREQDRLRTEAAND